MKTKLREKASMKMKPKFFLILTALLALIITIYCLFDNNMDMRLASLYLIKEIRLKIPSYNNALKQRARSRNQQQIEHVKDYCTKEMAKNYYLRYYNEHAEDEDTTQVDGTHLYFDFYYAFLYCQIAKAGSSTWTEHLLNIRGIKATQYQAVGTRGKLRNKVYHKDKDFSFREANDMLVTFAFTRHPFTRLASSYHNRIKYKGMRRNIRRETFKNPGFSEQRSNEYPSPKEFAVYLLDLAKQFGPLSFDVHWRPQYALCPFCSLDFDYIGDVDDMDKHVDYLADLLGFKNLINPDLHKNSLYEKEQTLNRYKSSGRINHVNSSEVDLLFYTQLPKIIIKQLYDTIYEPDFQMLGYEYPQEYIDMGYTDNVE